MPSFEERIARLVTNPTNEERKEISERINARSDRMFGVGHIAETNVRSAIIEMAAKEDRSADEKERYCVIEEDSIPRLFREYNRDYPKAALPQEMIGWIQRQFFPKE